MLRTNDVIEHLLLGTQKVVGVARERAGAYARKLAQQQVDEKEVVTLPLHTLCIFLLSFFDSHFVFQSDAKVDEKVDDSSMLLMDEGHVPSTQAHLEQLVELLALPAAANKLEQLHRVVVCS